MRPLSLGQGMSLPRCDCTFVAARVESLRVRTPDLFHAIRIRAARWGQSRGRARPRKSETVSSMSLRLSPVLSLMGCPLHRTLLIRSSRQGVQDRPAKYASRQDCPARCLADRSSNFGVAVSAAVKFGGRVCLERSGIPERRTHLARTPSPSGNALIRQQSASWL